MIFDLHNDLPTSKLTLQQQLSVAQNTADKVIYAFWTTELTSPTAFIEEGIKNFQSVDCLFAIEDLGFLQDNTIDMICSMPVRYCSLTHNEENRLAGGAFSEGKLTDFGKRVIDALNKADIAIDAAHLNRQSFFDVTDSAKRIINTHTGLDGYWPHRRNLTDEQVRIILERGGIIGLTAVADFIGGDNVTNYVRLIDCHAQKFGISGLCIGTDFYGTQPLKGLNRYDDFRSLAVELSKLGYSRENIGNIFYENANQFFSR